MPPPIAPVQHFDFAAAAGDAKSLEAFHAAVLAAMDKDGAAIVENALTSSDCDAIVTEMRPFLDATAPGHEFTGFNTKRTGAVAARSPSSHKVLTHPAVLQVCDSVLGEQRLGGNKVKFSYDVASVAAPTGPQDKSRPKYPWQLHLTQIIDIGPGEKGQSIHRDKWAFLYDFQGSEPEISTMWALTDFTEANGATRVIPGSHLWDERELKRKLTIEDTTFAAMPKGSVLLYTGSTFHAGGANQTSERRVGLNVDYNLGFLRQEENQYLSNPPHLARNYSKELQRLVGYSRAGGALGYYADTQAPSLALTGFDVSVPGGGLRPSKL